VTALIARKIALIYASVDASVGAVVPPPPVPTAAAPGETEEAFQARMRAAVEARERLQAERAAAEAAAAKDRAKGRVGAILARERGKAAGAPPALTPEVAAAVRAAFAAMNADDADMAELRNGVGWNKPDSFVAHCLMTAGLEDDAEVEAGLLMVRRYRRQLASDYPILFKEARA
jgi:hypothetical protein